MRGGVGEQVVVDAQVGLVRVDHLAAADPGVVELGVLLDGEDADDAAAGLAEEVDLALVEALAQVVGERDRVRHRLLGGQLLGS